MECFVIIVNDFQSLTIIPNRSILDVAAVLDPPLSSTSINIIHILLFRLHTALYTILNRQTTSIKILQIPKL